ISAPALSSPFSDSRRYLPRCPCGSIRRTIRGCANVDRPEIGSFFRTPDVSPRQSGERCTSNDVRLRPPPPERGLTARSGRILHLILVAEKVVELVQRLDQEIVDREPDRSAPIRITPEQACTGLRRFVGPMILMAQDPDHIGMIFVMAREGADAAGKQEFLFVLHITQQGFQAITTHE